MTPLAHLHETLEKTRVEAGLKGMSIAVMHRGEVIFADGFGQRNDTDPFTAEVKHCRLTISWFLTGIAFLSMQRHVFTSMLSNNTTHFYHTSPFFSSPLLHFLMSRH